MLRTRQLMQQLGYRDKKAVLRLFAGPWKVPGGTVMLPGRGPSGFEYALPASFFEKWLKSREVSQ